MKDIKDFMQKYGIICIFLLSIISKLFLLFKFHEFFWDESVYMGMGKYIFSFGGVGLWESIRPPLLPFLVGGVWWSGLDAALFSEFLIVLFSCGVLMLTYLIAEHIFDWKIGLASVCILAFTPVFFKFSSFVMTGIPSTFFVLLAIWFYIKDKGLVWVGVCAGLAFLTRYPQGIVIAALGFVIVCGRVKLFEKVMRFSAGVLAVFVPFVIFNYLMYRNEVVNIIHAALRPLIFAFKHQGNVFESVTGFAYNYLYYFINLFGENYLLIFALPGLVWGIKKYRLKILPLVVPLALYLIYFSLIANKQIRFSLAFLPIVAIFAGFGIVYCCRSALKSGRLVKYSVFIVIIFVVCTTGYSVAVEDWKVYHFRASGPPEIVSDFYYGYMNGLDEPILVSDPTSMGYIDKLMIGFYQDNIAGPQVYDMNKDKVGSIIFHHSVYPCVDGDGDCNERNEEFFARLNYENELVDVKEYYGEKYYVFVRS
ncbi:MAG: glycosyltransferase family 39 protein [Nanoarchaeota archaeon]|nr:glycosyltransferase family 39 protein [Nanoarchaeota archaeon]